MHTFIQQTNLKIHLSKKKSKQYNAMTSIYLISWPLDIWILDRTYYFLEKVRN